LSDQLNLAHVARNKKV